MTLIGIGVDIVSLPRVARFLKDHSDRLDRIFTVRERKLLAGRRSRVEPVARLLSAKEAIFKALGGSWMGIEGFRMIDVNLEEATAKVKPALLGRRRGIQFTLSTSRRSSLIVSQAVGVIP